MKFNYGLSALCSGALFLASCAIGDESADEAQPADLTARNGSLRIVEVSPQSIPGRIGAFLELRNDSDLSRPANGLILRIGNSRTQLLPMKLVSGTPDVIAPASLALIVDADTPTELLEAVACTAPVQTTRVSLGPGHSAADDPLAGTLELTAARACIPVLGAQNLNVALQGAGSVVLVRDASGGGAPDELDRIQLKDIKFPMGYSAERVDRTKFVLSPVGATPGARNALADQSEQVSASRQSWELSAYRSSPWRESGPPRVGQTAGTLGENPLASHLREVIRGAKKTIVAAFYQLNDDDVIADLVDAKKRRQVDVRIVTDAEFKDDENYTTGLKALTDVGIAVVYDENDRGANRAPLSHNKFLVVDGEWVWTGSYNPIKDEPERIHADNGVLLRSPELASLHVNEFGLLFTGKFGTLKRAEGVAGGDAFIAGASATVRFSPGLTEAQLRARSSAYVKSGSTKAACETMLGNGKPLIEDRYRSLVPCGGPTDLLYAEVARATSSIYFAEFSLALPELVDVVNERLSAGVDVRGVVDATISSKPATMSIAKAGGDVRYTPNSNPECPSYVSPKKDCPKNPNKVWMHHKFVVIDYGTDHPVVITGSHNMSDSAEEQNDEGLIAIRDRAVADTYYRMFREMYDHPQALSVSSSSQDERQPAVAITKVETSGDPAAPPVVWLTNLDAAPRPANKLLLWNRRQPALVITKKKMLAPGVPEKIIIGKDTKKPVGERSFVAADTALVLQSESGAWLSTFDPRGGPDGAAAAASIAAPYRVWEWTGIGKAQVDAMMVSLLGDNKSSKPEAPDWQPRGVYSDWGDGYEVIRSKVVRMMSLQAAWEGSEDVSK